MEILSFGDYIKDGSYLLHSKFNNVHNYTNENEIISLVSDKIGAGPNNIVLNIIPDTAEQSITIYENLMIIGDKNLVIDKSHKNYFSNDNFYLLNGLTFLSKIVMLSKNVVMNSKSLGFLLFPENEIFFESAFEKAFLAQVKQINRNISLENLPLIAKKMKGLGFGLTPSGDDFNCGILYALNYLNKIGHKNLTNIIEQCYSNSIGKNLISNTFLKFAFLNKYYENFYNLLKALQINEKDKILEYAQEVNNAGHTSGSDMLTGFLLTIINSKELS